jgi:hypothetical protein
VGEQDVLLELAGAAALDIRRAADGALVPAKTISFLAGMGRNARVDHYFVQCRRCWVEGCSWRRSAAVTRVQRDD